MRFTFFFAVWYCVVRRIPAVTPLVHLKIAVFNNSAISGAITNCTHRVTEITPPVKFPKISTLAKRDSLVLIFWVISTDGVIYSTSVLCTLKKHCLRTAKYLNKLWIFLFQFEKKSKSVWVGIVLWNTLRESDRKTNSDRYSLKEEVIGRVMYPSADSQTVFWPRQCLSITRINCTHPRMETIRVQLLPL